MPLLAGRAGSRLGLAKLAAFTPSDTYIYYKEGTLGENTSNAEFGSPGFVEGRHHLTGTYLRKAPEIELEDRKWSEDVVGYLLAPVTGEVGSDKPVLVDTPS